MTYSIKSGPVLIKNTGEDLEGSSREFRVFNQAHSTNRYSNGFTGTHCSNLLLKIIAYIGSFFGAGLVLSFNIKGKDCNDTHTFWVNRDIAEFFEGFGFTNKQNLTIEKSSTLWFSRCIDIVVTENVVQTPERSLKS